MNNQQIIMNGDTSNVQSFMEEFLHARLLEEQRLQQMRAPFRKKFFTDDCQWDRREQTLEMLQSEKVANIEESNSGAVVYTSHSKPFHPIDSSSRNFRYHLKREKSSWLISHVELECVLCNGLGDSSCAFCKGKHWL